MCDQCLITKEMIIDNLQKNYFVNYYQPIVNVKENIINGVEVLLRLKNPLLDNVCPECFIACAENENVINDLFFFSAEQAIKDISNNKSFNKLSINLSPKTLNVPNLYSWLKDKCNKYDIKKESVTLEITENVEYVETDISLENIENLRMLGFGLSIDDFGTGYSSYSRLKSMPFTELKIDKMFIKHIKTNNSDKKIIEHLVNLAQILGLQTVAEGIEDLETYHIIKNLGVNLCQGYFFHKPMAINDVLAL
ncbi:EAL domain-containing protein [Photobacterium iliopiscarium]|jgi:EAL domain-containing protein (putative c-di-GMP-specific phosphodiesterase class I)|uniref:EAL domain-containing protein n=1 Tax=Photobacterium iliopiscarium TaxID=56192 RepID=A0ABX5GR02_9GAMM|nr:EAL domain-containing protein [Photobacterium iliopiscarium]PST95875.1 EAL domain-containing protein [Photobacterium iliopiscarium]PSW95117.1 EAL domain-containing protein [Photobacterium iliopiscarium]